VFEVDDLWMRRLVRPTERGFAALGGRVLLGPLTALEAQSVWAGEGMWWFAPVGLREVRGYCRAPVWVVVSEGHRGQRRGCIAEGFRFSGRDNQWRECVRLVRRRGSGMRRRGAGSARFLQEAGMLWEWSGIESQRRWATAVQCTCLVCVWLRAGAFP
jgi:hypothetical protein